MDMPVRKHILIPDSVPLYAMRRCFGPERGPLTAPTLTPVDIIGELLKQSGKEKCTIYEVVKTGTTITARGNMDRYSTPVELTLENYKLPYEQIAGTTTTPEKVEVPATTTPVPETPVEEPAKVVATQIPEPDPETPNETPATTEKVADASDDDQDKTADEVTPIATTGYITPAEVGTDSKEDAPGTVTTASDNAPTHIGKMTKAERRAARRAEAAAAAAKSAEADSENGTETEAPQGDTEENND